MARSLLVGNAPHDFLMAASEDARINGVAT